MDSTADQVVQNAVTLVSTWGLRVAGALAVLIIGRFACGVARKAVRRGMEGRGVDASLIPFISNFVYFVLLAAVVIAVLGLFGIETTSLVAVLGTAGLAIGLALQGTWGNFSSGVMLLLFRPFRVGDYIEAAGAAGTVSEIGVFSTTLNTPDNVRIIIPNSGIFGATIKNFSANDTRRNDIVLGISYDDVISNAIAVVNAVLSKDSRVLSDPEPLVAVGQGRGDETLRPRGLKVRLEGVRVGDFRRLDPLEPPVYENPLAVTQHLGEQILHALHKGAASR